MKLGNRHISAWMNFNNALDNFRAETGEDFAILYEDAHTTRQVKDFKIDVNGTLTWLEMDWLRGKITEEREQVMDVDDGKEWLKFWKSCLKRAKRYWSMDAVELDRIQDGEQEDIEIE